MQIDHTELDQFIDRYKIFLSKLEARAKELEEETLIAAQEIIDQDEYRFINFKAGMRGQFESLVKKAKEIYKEQIKSRKISNSSIENKLVSEDEALKFNSKIKGVSELVDLFEEHIDNLFENIFNKVKVVSPEKKLKQTLEEYEIIKQSFSCTQCGSKLKLNKVYFVSAYITCEYCQCQNTFIPSIKMSLLPDLVKEIADKRTGDFNMPTDATLVQKFEYWEDHSRKQLLIKKKLIPELEKSYLDIYIREIFDFINQFYDDNNFNSKELDQLINLIEEKYFIKDFETLIDSIKEKTGDKQLSQINKLIDQNKINQKLLNSVLFNHATIKQSSLQNLAEELQKLENLKSTINL